MNPYNGFTGAQRQRSLPWLHRQYDAGLPRPSCCDACEQTEGILDHHAEDYSEPFGPHIYEFSLCYRCHMILHCRFRAPEAFERYQETLRAGRRFRPMTARSYFRFAAEHLRGHGEPETIQASDGPLRGFEAVLAAGRVVVERMG